MKINKLIYIFFIYLISLTNAYSIEPDQFVQLTVDRASKLLSNSVSKDDKIKIWDLTKPNKIKGWEK